LRRRTRDASCESAPCPLAGVPRDCLGIRDTPLSLCIWPRQLGRPLGPRGSTAHIAEAHILGASPDEARPINAGAKRRYLHLPALLSCACLVLYPRTDAHGARTDRCTARYLGPTSPEIRGVLGVRHTQSALHVALLPPFFSRPIQRSPPRQQRTPCSANHFWCGATAVGLLQEDSVAPPPDPHPQGDSLSLPCRPWLRRKFSVESGLPLHPLQTAGPQESWLHIKLGQDAGRRRAGRGRRLRWYV